MSFPPFRRISARVIALAALFSLVAVLGLAAAAQNPPVPKVEVFGGYSLLDPLSNDYGLLPGTTLPAPVQSGRMKLNPTGVGGSVTFNVNGWFGLTLDSSTNWSGDYAALSDRLEHTRFTNVSFGPRFTLRSGRAALFAEALFGANWLHPDAFTNVASPGFLVGTGLDIRVAKHVAIEPFHVDFVYSRYRFGPAPQTVLHGLRYEAGVVFLFGGGPPPPPAAAACAVTPSAVFAGQTVTASATGENFNPSRALRYAWSGQGFTITGSGASTQVNTTGLQPGQYTIRATLTDGTRRGVASCDAAFVVKTPQPPVIACSADPATVTTGGSSTITSNASSPDGRPLTYSYTASAGAISGSGGAVTLNTAGAAPGTITVDCNVQDDRTPPLTASATTTVTVEAPPPPPAPQPPPEEKRLEQRLALHSIYFQTARPTIANPNGGLLPSQAGVLDRLAADFNEYLHYSPNANLILTGHADRRGSAAFNQALTQRRVNRAKEQLVADGVPASHILTVALGSERALTAAQVRELVETDPSLSPDQRRRALANLRLLTLANNRRVDVTLSTTGQKSRRLYPFNTADFLQLVSPQGVHPAPRRHHPRQRRH